MTEREQIDPSDAAEAALAYALWDSENTTRMKAECIQEHIARAKAVQYWLKVHGHKIVADGELTKPPTKDGA